MHLLRIELENFKSFGGQITVPFDQGFTAITGPNGSGKSNCGDAIQFVLGTRSTKVIRAANVAELIFNGGKSGKAARHMSATLVFANTPESDGLRRIRVEGDEISFTRAVRLGRKNNPISSYRIGDKPATATEMRRVLAEAGLHGDGYNIVQQGDVTNLATMTPHRRRGVLEEVAGVKAYDDEIRRSQNQRKRVEGDIQTIDLFESDQKTQLKELEKERAQALKFKELKDEQDEARIVLAQTRYRSRHDEIRLLNEEQVNYTEKDEGLRGVMRDSNQKLLELDEELVRVRLDIDEMASGESKKVLDQIRALDIEVETSRDRIGDSRRASEEATEETEELNGDLEGVLGAEEKIQATVDAAQTATRAADENLVKAEADESEARTAIESGDKHARDLNRALGKATEAVTEAHTERAEARLEADRAEQNVRLASDRLADLEEEYESATFERDDLELTGEDLQDETPTEDRSTLATQMQKIMRDEVNLREDRDRAEGKVREANRALDKARARQEARASRPGSAVTLRALAKLRESGEIKGILGSLGELSAPKDAANEEALAFALGGGMNSIIVTDDKVAGSCIKWLRANGGGRATFLPLNKISASRTQGRALMVARNPGIIGFAHDLLDYDEEIETAVRFACRNTLIVQSMDVARRNMGGVRMVTLDGSIVEATGAMTGGSSNRGSRPNFGGAGAGGLGYEKLESAVENANLIYSVVEAALKELRINQQDLRNKINGLDDSDHSVKVREWKADVGIAQKLVDDVGRKVIDVRKEFEGIEAECKTIQASAASVEKTYEDAVEARRAAGEDLQNHTPDHLSKLLRSAQDTRTEAERTKLRSEAEISSGTERLSVLADRRTGLTRAINRQQGIIDAAAESIEKLKGIISRADEQLDELKSVASQFDEEQQQLNTRREEIVDERASLRAAVDQLERQRENIQTRLESLAEQIRQKEDTVGELRAELAELEISVPSPETQLPTVAEAEKRVQGLDRRLGQLGDVNMLAIEQYDRTVERIADLVTDGKTLRERKEMLVSIVEQLEDERCTRLLAVFDHVNKNFQRVYAILQPGGTGTLRLENPRNPFEGGLEMACVPPGKSRNTRRSYLSGGEKSMAALGLVFAIQDYEPSPFYYLDEVDQNLDPFNAERIATLCRLRSQNAQFIMVTLRKVSLTLADHHIGITHAGDGISRRIADFDRAAALQLGDEFEAEAKAREEAAADKAEMDELPEPEDMPKTPEPLGTPQSLGGLAERAGIEIDGDEDVEDAEDDAEDSDVAADGEEIPTIDATAVEAAAELATEGLESLRERTEEWTEDITEKEAATPLTEDESAVDPSEPVNGVEVEAEAEAEAAPEMEE